MLLNTYYCVTERKPYRQLTLLPLGIWQKNSAAKSSFKSSARSHKAKMLLPIALGLSSSPSSLKGKTALRHCVELLYTHDVCILNMTETHNIGNANQGNWSSNFKIEKSFLTSLELTVPTANCTTFFFFPTLTSYTRTEICLIYHEVYACHSTCSTWKIIK